jgi:hypothetical protein
MSDRLEANDLPETKNASRNFQEAFQNMGRTLFSYQNLMRGSGTILPVDDQNVRSGW